MSIWIIKKPFPNVYSVLMRNYILIRKIVRRTGKAPSVNDLGAFFAGETVMLFYNANIFQGKYGFKTGGFEVENGKFVGLFFDADKPDDNYIYHEGINLQGNCVIPGLIDIHTHGNMNADFSDGDMEGLETMSEYLLKNGITSFLPTSMTLPLENLKKSFNNAKKLGRIDKTNTSRILGIHMEGPFLSEKYKGAQNKDYLQLPDFDAFYELQKSCNDLIKIVDIAPELEGADVFIKKAKSENPNVTVSLAHTDANYETAKSAFEAGAGHVTHLFNGMTPLHHRNPGVIGAAADRDDIAVELICDGLHVHPAVIRLAFKLFPHRVCLISDALRCCGMPDGEYELGGQMVTLKDGEARLKDGTLAGSATNLFECMKNAISFGVPMELAIEAATNTPAKSIGMQDSIGSIDVGKFADFTVCDNNLTILQIYKNGNRCQ